MCLYISCLPPSIIDVTSYLSAGNVNNIFSELQFMGVTLQWIESLATD